MRTIPQQESLTVEFKSDQSRFNDRDLVATVVCLANTDGGVLYLGVEDDGTITGTHPQRQTSAALSALIANRTNPPSASASTFCKKKGIPSPPLRCPNPLDWSPPQTDCYNVAACKPMALPSVFPSIPMSSLAVNLPSVCSIIPPTPSWVPPSMTSIP
jgi:hypothetical protein